MKQENQWQRTVRVVIHRHTSHIGPVNTPRTDNHRRHHILAHPKIPYLSAPEAPPSGTHPLQHTISQAGRAEAPRIPNSPFPGDRTLAVARLPASRRPAIAAGCTDRPDTTARGDATLVEGGATNFSQCHGLAGNAECLLGAQRALGNGRRPHRDTNVAALGRTAWNRPLCKPEGSVAMRNAQ